MDRRQNFRGNTQSLTIPIDLIIEILLRLTAKSIAICRCVSKQWKSLLRSPHFTKSFLIRSSSQPRILITFQTDGKWHFFSSPQPRNLDKELTHVAADYHMSLSGHPYSENCLSVNGFICLIDKNMLMAKRDRVPVLCNPSTGQHVTLPKVKARNNDLRSFFGYDPIDKQYKVLCMTVSIYRRQVNSKEHQVLTLGKGKILSWRRIECSFPHYPDDKQDGICINGVMYYVARPVPRQTSLIACFNVRSEKLSFIKKAEGCSLHYFSALVNYKGKLGAVIFYGSHGELWVLDDTEKEKWSKHIFVLPDKAFHHIIKSTWVTDRDEIAWVQNPFKSPFCVYYSNLETKSVRRLMIEGIDEQALMGFHRFDPEITVRDHVENLMFL